MKKREFYFEQINALLENYTPKNVSVYQKSQYNTYMQPSTNQICLSVGCSPEMYNIPYISTSGYSPEMVPYKLSFLVQQKNYELELQENNIIFKYTDDSEFKIYLELTSEEHAMLLLQFYSAYEEYLKLVHDRMLIASSTDYTFESQLMEGCIPDATK